MTIEPFIYGKPTRWASLPVRPAHHLAGMPSVARYSSRRHPPALPQSVGKLYYSALVTHHLVLKMVGASRFELPVRPPHPLGGVPRVAPYSSQRHPPALSQSVGNLYYSALITHRLVLKMVGASRFELPTSCSQGRRAKPGCATPRIGLSKPFY